MEQITLQKLIFIISGCKTKREYSQKLNKTLPYISNQLNSNISISVKLAIDNMKDIGLSNDRMIEIIKLYLKTNFGLIENDKIEQKSQNEELFEVNSYYDKIISDNQRIVKESNSVIQNLNSVIKKQEKEILELKRKNYRLEKKYQFVQKSELNENYNESKLFDKVEKKIKTNNDIDFIKNVKHKERHKQNLIDYKLKHYYIIIDKLIKKIILKEEFDFDKNIGCNYLEFKNYLEKSFTKKMNWENYGLWVVRLIKAPDNIGNIKNYIYFENLQPVWLITNENNNDENSM